jgi:hypothetical protein
LAKDKGAQPKRTSRDENHDSRAGKTENEGSNDYAKAKQPENPAFLSFAKIILTAGENYDRSQSEKVSGLISIGEGAKAAPTNPKR